MSGKLLECDCGFRAGGSDTTLEELGDVAVIHLRTAHPERYEKLGEETIRDRVGEFVREVA